MKKSEFELFALIFSIVPVIVFVSNVEPKLIIYGLINIAVASIVSYRNEIQLPKGQSIPSALASVTSILIFTPSIISLFCFWHYTDINNAYWAFFLNCWAFGAATTGFIKS
ncbi:hypothetical protein [Alteromonas sp. S015]|uniref:hypothetical protein n=1 Tax=Alteromonas sp. S015 TaxID=3117401 RepID=UPI002FE20FCB